MAPVLGETVGEARRRRGWSIKQLSKRSGVLARLIREVESQSPTYVPSETNTVLLAETLRVPAEDPSLRRGSGCSSTGTA